MSSFLERLTSVMHWIGFIISLIIFYGLFTNVTPGQSYIFSAVIALFPNTVCWLIKYVLTGNGNYFPF